MLILYVFFPKFIFKPSNKKEVLRIFFYRENQVHLKLIQSLLFSTCELTMNFPDSPEYIALGTGYESWNKLCASKKDIT